MIGSENMVDVLLEAINGLERQIINLGSDLADLKRMHEEQTSAKDWYSTSDLAELMGVSQYTAQERWCNGGRIACEKNPETGKWRIPASEYERLRRGGNPRPGK